MSQSFEIDLVSLGLLFFPEVSVLDISVREICPACAGGKKRGVPRPQPGLQEQPKHTACEGR